MTSELQGLALPSSMAATEPAYLSMIDPAPCRMKGTLFITEHTLRTFALEEWPWGISGE